MYIFWQQRFRCTDICTSIHTLVFQDTLTEEKVFKKRKVLRKVWKNPEKVWKNLQEVTTITIYFINPSVNLKLLFDCMTYSRCSCCLMMKGCQELPHCLCSHVTTDNSAKLGQLRYSLSTRNEWTQIRLLIVLVRFAFIFFSSSRWDFKKTCKACYSVRLLIFMMSGSHFFSTSLILIEFSELELENFNTQGQ